MIIGINASPAFKFPRTGVEEYTYQLINHLTKLKEAESHRFFLYIDVREATKLQSTGCPNPSEIWQPTFSACRPRLKSGDHADRPAKVTLKVCCLALDLPSNFILKPLSAPFFWTQGRLAWQLRKDKPDVFFSPGHVLPRFHPENSVVTIHGLEFERCPQFYPSFHRFYLKKVTKYAVSRAKKIIAVSNNTKKDLVELYKVPPNKIMVIYHGLNKERNVSGFRFHVSCFKKYILFLGTKEKKKNISNLIKAFEILKDRYKIPHRLILAGREPNKRFYKPEKIEDILKKSRYKKDIINLDFVSEDKKKELFQKAALFIYPSFYEGFGMPILEAQIAGTPVITSNISALPEIAGDGAMKITPHNIEEIAQAMYKIISDKNTAQNLINKGYQNIKKFSWQTCAQETLSVLLTP